jgi:hypothetical protein
MSLETGETGSMDLIQVVVAFMIIGIAAASATFSIYIGRGALDSEWRKKRAMEIARDEMEYWTAMIYEGQEEIENQNDALPIRLINKSISRNEILDPLSSTTDKDDIICEVIRNPLEKNQVLRNRYGLQVYDIEIMVIWQEPAENPNLTFPPDTVKLNSWMIYQKI